MAHAKICSCGHTASWHKVVRIKKQKFHVGECEGDECPCEKFNHVRTVAAQKVNYEQ